MKPIIVVGTGTAAYMAVAYFYKMLPNEIIWYRPDAPAIGVGEATTPGVLDFLKKIDIDEKSVIKDLDGTMKLGIHFRDFLYEGHDYRHPFGFDKDEHAVNLELMKEDSILTDFSNTQAVHFDIIRIQEILDERFKGYDRLTIKHEFFEYTDNVKDSYIIDSSGFARAVISKVPGYEFIDYTHKIQNNRAYVYRDTYKDKQEQKKPYTIMQATDRGWIWHIPLSERISIGYVHTSKYDCYDQFVEYLTEYFGREIDKSQIHTVNMISGRNNKSIVEHNTNTIAAIGLSSTFIEPMESTGLFFTINGIESITEVIAGRKTLDEHNDMVAYNYDSTVNFIVLHYAYNKRQSDYWKFYQNVPKDWYEKQTNGCWHDLSWQVVTDGLLDKHKEYKVIDIRKAINLKLKKTPFANFEIDLDTYSINKDLDRDI